MRYWWCCDSSSRHKQAKPRESLSNTIENGLAVPSSTRKNWSSLCTSIRSLPWVSTPWLRADSSCRVKHWRKSLFLTAMSSMFFTNLHSNPSVDDFKSSLVGLPLRRGPLLWHPTPPLWFCAEWGTCEWLVGRPGFQSVFIFWLWMISISSVLQIVYFAYRNQQSPFTQTYWSHHSACAIRTIFERYLRKNKSIHRLLLRFQAYRLHGCISSADGNTPLVVCRTALPLLTIITGDNDSDSLPSVLRQGTQKNRDHVGQPWLWYRLETKHSIRTCRSPVRDDEYMVGLDDIYQWSTQPASWWSAGESCGAWWLRPQVINDDDSNTVSAGRCSVTGYKRQATSRPPRKQQENLLQHSQLSLIIIPLDYTQPWRNFTKFAQEKKVMAALHVLEWIWPVLWHWHHQEPLTSVGYAYDYITLLLGNHSMHIKNTPWNCEIKICASGLDDQPKTFLLRVFDFTAAT